MAETTYTYSISGDFPNGKVVLDLMKTQIQASSIAEVLVAQGILGDDYTATFQNALSSSDETTLDGLVAAHTGIYSIFEPREYWKLINTATSVGVADWEGMGGASAKIVGFLPQLSQAVLKVSGVLNSSGTGAQLRLVETDLITPVVLNGTAFSVPDSTLADKTFSFLTDVAPRSGDFIYEVQGRLNGATAATIKYTGFTLLKKVTF